MRWGRATGVDQTSADGMAATNAGAPSVIGNVIWFLLAGWWLALSHLVIALLFAITIIGIPFAVQHLKLVPLSLLPFGRELR